MKSKRRAPFFSRREFLQLSLATCGGLVLASCNSQNPTEAPKNNPAETSKPLSGTSTTGAIEEPADGLSNQLTVEERVNGLVDQMTLKEKIAQMGSEAPEIERLGIPAYNWWSEALHGVGRAGIATVFPQAIGLAATWNCDLMHRVATAI